MQNTEQLIVVYLVTFLHSFMTYPKIIVHRTCCICAVQKMSLLHWLKGFQHKNKCCCFHHITYYLQFLGHTAYSRHLADPRSSAAYLISQISNAQTTTFTASSLPSFSVMSPVLLTYFLKFPSIYGSTITNSSFSTV